MLQQHSLTLNNEKKLIRLLSDKIGDEILDELILKWMLIKSYLIEEDIKRLDKNLILFFGENLGLKLILKIALK